MEKNLASQLNKLGLGLTAIAAMSKLPNVTNETARRWCRKKRLPPKVHGSLARGSLPVWGRLINSGRLEKAEELWDLIAIQEKPNIAQVMVFICDTQEAFLAAEAGVSLETVNNWLYHTPYFSGCQKDQLSSLYRTIMDRVDHAQAKFLKQAWVEKKPPRKDSALARCLTDLEEHCKPAWDKARRVRKLRKLGHSQTVIYNALRAQD